MPLAPNEDVVRAILTDKWDGQRASPSLFKGQDVSVSRLAIILLADHWDMFRLRLENLPERRRSASVKSTSGIFSKLVAITKTQSN
jgi:hypothetical protein